MTTIPNCTPPEVLEHSAHQRWQPDKSGRGRCPQLHTDRLLISWLGCLSWVPIKSVDGIDGTITSTDCWMFSKWQETQTGIVHCTTSSASPLTTRKLCTLTQLTLSLHHLHLCLSFSQLYVPLMRPFKTFKNFSSCCIDFKTGQYLMHRYTPSGICKTLRPCLIFSWNNLSLSRERLCSVGMDGWMETCYSERVSNEWQTQSRNQWQTLLFSSVM